jgi:ABC-type transporter Mla maintaining outer membrane lipid asymmetry permease subunit MlaE
MERSLGELFGDLTRDMSMLIRQETQLATTEMTQKAARAGKSASVFLGGALVAYAGFFALLGAIVYGLVTLVQLPIWASFLIVGVVAFVIGAFMAWRGYHTLKKTDFVPRQTVETLKEDAQWAKEQTA